MTDAQGYSSIAIYVVLVAGIILAIVRPYWALYAALLTITAIDRNQAAFTRTDLLGPYFNLFDALLMIILSASFIAVLKERRTLIIPAPAIAIFVVLLIGSFTIALQADLEYQVLRAIRWSLNFPLAFIAMANAISNKKQARYVFLSLFLGSTIAALQHIYLVASGETASGLFYGIGVAGLLRTLAFVSAGTFFLVAAPFLELPRQKTWRLVYIAALVAMAVSTLLNQTRSIWIALLLSAVTMGFLLGKLRKTLLVFALLALATGFVFQVLWQDTGPFEIVSSRFEELFVGVEQIDSANNLTLGLSERGRALQIETETRMWLEGNWLIGRGLGFTDSLSIRSEFGSLYDLIAWGHVGHVAYLARLGLVGLVVFSIYLPLAGLRNVLYVIRNTNDEYVMRLALVGMSVVIFGWYVAFMSSSYLEWVAAIPGILYGTIWAMKNSLERSGQSVEYLESDENQALVPLNSVKRQHPNQTPQELKA